jgi:GNAT superfamily N-acetyltransferase
VRSYRTTILLCGLILLGWLWDGVLGGGAVHWFAWFGALILVGGISGLTSYAARRHQGAQPIAVPAAGPAAVPDAAVRVAEPAEYPELIEIEVAADRLFPLAGYGETPGPAELSELEQALRVLVSGSPATGYVRIEEVDGRAHVESLSVRPRFMRQGRGTALMQAACDWAASAGYREVTLCTFADVPWNAPFYRQLGFVELDNLTPGLERLRAAERRVRLDDLGRRVVLIKALPALTGNSALS